MDIHICACYFHIPNVVDISAQTTKEDNHYKKGAQELEHQNLAICFETASKHFSIRKHSSAEITK